MIFYSINISFEGVASPLHGSMYQGGVSVVSPGLVILLEAMNWMERWVVQASLTEELCCASLPRCRRAANQATTARCTTVKVMATLEALLSWQRSHHLSPDISSRKTVAEA